MVAFLLLILAQDVNFFFLFFSLLNFNFLSFIIFLSKKEIKKEGWKDVSSGNSNVEKGKEVKIPLSLRFKRFNVI